MTTVYLIRHAEAEGNLFRRIHGQYDSPVTVAGRRQIACLERRFAAISVDAVYSSDLKRARQTAQAICGAKGLQLHTDPDLREIYLGEWEDRCFGEVMRAHMEEMVRFSTGDPDWYAPGGEQLRQVGDRVEVALRRIVSAERGRTVAIVSHGTAIRQLLSRLLRRPVAPGSYLPEGHNTAVSCLEIHGDEIVVRWINDASHLTEEVLAAALRPDQGREDMARGTVPPQLFWFRPWDPATERERYLACRAEGWRSSHGTMAGFDGPAFLNAVLAHSGYDRSAVLTVMSGEQPAGILELDLERGREEGVGAIAFYYVDQFHRRHGLGVQLLGQAVSTYRALGRDKLRLRCAPENDTALRFYRRHGFYEIGRIDSSSVPLLLMERPIE